MPEIVVAETGWRGFDTNQVVDADAAQAFAAMGYRFAVRYVPRQIEHPNDLSADETETLLAAGLCVMPVQHVESESSWTPTDDKGRSYGATAAESALAAGILLGSSVWLDLEGVAAGVDAEQVIRYCNYWFDRVASAGFLPGIYVGWHARLTPEQLYKRLRFARYWSAYNLNSDQYPAVCGVCMKQHAAPTHAKPVGVTLEIDVDVITGDALNRFPVLTGPDSP